MTAKEYEEMAADPEVKKLVDRLNSLVSEHKPSPYINLQQTCSLEEILRGEEVSKASRWKRCAEDDFSFSYVEQQVHSIKHEIERIERNEHDTAELIKKLDDVDDDWIVTFFVLDSLWSPSTDVVKDFPELP